MVLSQHRLHEPFYSVLASLVAAAIDNITGKLDISAVITIKRLDRKSARSSGLPSHDSSTACAHLSASWGHQRL